MWNTNQLSTQLHHFRNVLLLALHTEPSKLYFEFILKVVFSLEVHDEEKKIGLFF